MKSAIYVLLCNGQVDQIVETPKSALREYNDLSQIDVHGLLCIRIEGGAKQVWTVANEIDEHLRWHNAFGRKAIARLGLKYPGCKLTIVGPMALRTEIHNQICQGADHD